MYSLEKVKNSLKKFGKYSVLAEKLGYSYSYIRIVMAGKSPLTQDFILKVCQLTGLEFSYFLENENDSLGFSNYKSKIEEVVKENETLKQQITELKDKLILAMSKQLGIF